VVTDARPRADAITARLEAECFLAFASALHPRLGAQSLVGALQPELVLKILALSLLQSPTTAARLDALVSCDALDLQAQGSQTIAGHAAGTYSPKYSSTL
jgi:hypothetical protein